jgi:hypothetical protein
MAYTEDTRPEDLDALTAPAVVDIVPIVDDPSGTPLTKKITLANLLKVVASLTAITSGYHASEDELLILDNTVAKKTTLPNLFAGIEDFLSDIAAVPAQTDTLLVIDGGVAKYVQRSNLQVRYIQPRLIEAATELTVTNDVGDWRFHVPPDLDGLSLVYVHAVVDTAGVTGTQTFQVRNATDTTDMLSTLLTIPTTETDSSTGTPAVIKSDGSEVVNTNDLIVVDSDVIQTTVAKGLTFTAGFG